MIAEGVEIENLIGSPYNDDLRGNDLDNWIAAGDGDDWIFSSGGVDTVFAGAGEDTFYVASFINATTELWLEAGNDQLIIDGQGPDESVSFAFTAHGGEGLDSPQSNDMSVQCLMWRMVSSP